MAWFAGALPYVTAGLSVATTIGQSNAQEQIANIEANQLEAQAIADQAEAAQTAKFERKRTEELKSRVTALAAKSGSSGLDVDRTISDIDEQGNYNALAAIHSGTSAASSKRYAATVSKSRGKQAKSSGYAQGGATILGAMDNLYG